MTTPTPPSALDIEMVVLGTVMIAPVIHEINDILTPEMFFDRGHREIWAAQQALYASGTPIDIWTVSQHLKASGALKSIAGGMGYISTLTNSVASGANIEYHARILIGKYVSRSCIDIGTIAREKGMAGEDAFALLDDLSASITDLYAQTEPNDMGSAADDILAITDGTPGKFYTTGVPDLDRIIALYPGLMHLFAARPGIGKSIVMVDILWHLTLVGPVLLFSPEMTRRQVTSRILARESGIPYSRIIRKDLREEESDDLARTAMRIADRMATFKVDPTSGITHKSMRAKLERAMKKSGIVAFGVDYLQLVTTGDPRIDSDDFRRVTQCSSAITTMAKNTMLPAIVASQLNRSVESQANKRPMMSHLRSTGQIEQDSAVVVLMYRDGYYQTEPPYEDTMEFSVAKHRDGATGTATCPITPALSRLGYPVKPSISMEQ